MWRRIAPFVAAAALFAGYVGLTRLDDNSKSNGKPAITVSVDFCRFDNGYVEAGGFVTNRGSRTKTVRVNLLVSGRYVGTDVVFDIAPGQRKSWETFDTTTPGSCSAEVEGT